MGFRWPWQGWWILVTLVPLAFCSSECDAPDDMMERFDRLALWITENGGSISSEIEVKPLEQPFDGNGVVARSDLAKNFTFARIPLGVMINIEHALASEVNIEGQLEYLNDVDALALFLCNEASKGASSKWSPFMDIWPTSWKNFPLFLSTEQLGVIDIEDRRLFEEIMKFRDTVNERFRSLDDTTCSLEEFKQYVSLVRSRMFAVRVFGYGRWHKTFCLVPFADLLNTGPKTNCDCITNLASTHLECFLTVAVGRGEQLLAPYVYETDAHGQNMNRHLWMHYGFTLWRADWEASGENQIHHLRMKISEQ